MPSAATVRITPPIADFMRELRASPERLDLGVRKRFREMSSRVRDDARGRASSAHPASHSARATSASGARKSQHWKDLVNSITSGATGNSPYVSVGSSRVPWALGFEFGSKQYRQFPSWTGRGPGAGRFFWPAVVANTPRVRDEMVEALNEALHTAFPDR